MDAAFVLGDEVREAQASGTPVVALETAVVTHGLPEPRNLEAIDLMDAAIRAGGAIPATCLVLDGRLIVGATRAEIEQLASKPNRDKASVRDLGLVIAMGASAGLTVSATLFAASRSGIRVFATGGIGGVHIPAALGDVSADLLQLTRSPVITICSGAKSVLDIPRTLEFLETAAVAVVGYGTERFPAFYLVDSGQRVPRLASAQAVARVAEAGWGLGLSAGVVVGNPIPAAHAIDPERWGRWLWDAQQDAEQEQIRGKAVTPYLLEHVASSSGGLTVQANIALLENNARVAAEISVTLQR